VYYHYWRVAVRAVFFRPAYACVREWLSVRSCARRILQLQAAFSSGFPGRRAEATARRSGGQGTRCWQAHRSKERMC
jgi:hypothetical protein